MSKADNFDWLNRDEYPFKAHYFETAIGNIHYIDEGNGPVIVFIHGNPSWSFEFRNLIKELSKTYRCIALDHIGFGLSDKPVDWSYLPKEHAKNLDTFIESFELKDITIFCGDWGGPIGLSYAINHPDKIKNIIMTNTWLWPLKNDLYYQLFSMIAGGKLGRFLIKKLNFFTRFIVKLLFGDKLKLTKDIHKHFIMPFNNPESRKGTWIFPKHLIDSSDWIESLYKRIDNLKEKNILIAWGMRDKGFRKKELEKWINIFPNAKVLNYEDAGHFVAEEKASEINIEMKIMMQMECE